jgi:hypothetical protein
MKSPEQFFAELGQTSRQPVSSSTTPTSLTALHPEVRQAAIRGLAVFPVPEIAQWTGNPDRLIERATDEVSRLQELAAENPRCAWRATSSRFCILRLQGPEGRAWFAAKNSDQDDVRTLSAVRGEIIWAVFQWPVGLVLRRSCNELAAGVRILITGESFPIPPSRGCIWVNPWAEIEAVPYWLREFAFVPPDGPAGKKAVPPSRSVCPSPCRLVARIEPRPSAARKGYPSCNQAGWKGSFRVSRRR